MHNHASVFKDELASMLCCIICNKTKSVCFFLTMCGNLSHLNENYRTWLDVKMISLAKIELSPWQPSIIMLLNPKAYYVVEPRGVVTEF